MALPLRISHWTANQNLNTSTFTEVFKTDNLTLRGILYQAVWQLNSNDVIVQLVLDNEVALEVDLSVLELDFMMGQGNNRIDIFPVVEYANKRWIFKAPSGFMHSYIKSGSFLFRMKAKSGGATKTVVGGMTVWGEP